ncbi:hypothetical protein EDB92DRAFT_1948105 [Lactarius akahatsu]|uniref:Zn(2)-C6 fungal-type domain-containing protein n=1 Tax=Lactarius akahatsu TaxID=416441 RepID=A0AAD4Q6G5_9AGAM|nr:hypothetical protein EDB92DRAFT_1948105 [Lactarius akahatsu]
MSPPDHNCAVYDDALQEVFALLNDWSKVPMCTAEVGDYAMWVLAAEYEWETFAVNAGTAADIPAGCCAVFSSLHGEVCTFAAESWLKCFPSFVVDLEPQLCAYAAELRTTEQCIVEDGYDEPGPRASLWAFLFTLKESHKAHRMSDDDYEWFCTRARLALNELGVSPALDAGVTGVAAVSDTATTTATAAVTEPAPSLCATPAALPGLPMVPPVAIDIVVTSFAVSPDIPEGRNSSLKHACLSPDTGSSRPSRCISCKHGHAKCKPIVGSSKCLHCLQTGHICELHTSSTTLALPAAGLLGPSPPSSTLPLPLPVVASPAWVSPVLVGLNFVEVNRLGTAAFWCSEVAQAWAAVKASQAHLRLAERSLLLALGELVMLPLQAGPSSSRASSHGYGSVVKGKGKERK